MLFQGRLLDKFRDALFLLCLGSLPLAEWRIFFLPINERVFGLDLTGYRSASIFDAAFFLFSLLMIPLIIQSLKEKKLMSWYLVFLVPGFALVPVLYFYLKPFLPYLTPSFPNVIDTRYYLVHLTVLIVVAIYLGYKSQGKVVALSHYYYVVLSLVFGVLSVFALMEASFFRTHYPFSAPFTISFPFRNQNAAAPFISMCILGLLGAAVQLGKVKMLWICFPSLVLAAALTGSRSNMVLLIVSIIVFSVAYLLWGRQGSQIHKFSSPFSVCIISICIGFIIVGGFYQWQPVQRSLSVLKDVMSDPSVLVFAQEGSPRNELWRHMASEVAKDGVENPKESFKQGNPTSEEETFSLSLFSVVNGSQTSSRDISGLKTNTRYFIRLTNSRFGTMLVVFSDRDRTKLVDLISWARQAQVAPHLYLFASDTGSDRINLGGWLDEFSIRTGGNSERVTFDNDEKLLWDEEWYEEKFGSSTGLLRSDNRKLELKAKEMGVKAHVGKKNVLSIDEKAFILEYELLIDNLATITPIVPPVRFFVGFHDADLSGGGAKWESISNGLLVSHVRNPKSYESELANNKFRESMAYKIMEEPYRHLPDDVVAASINKEITSGQNMKINLDSLSRQLVDKDLISSLRGYSPGGWVDDSSGDSISVTPNKAWSAAGHIAGRGSAHNVFLDWIYYVGFVPFILFLLFVFGMLTALAVFVWRRRMFTTFPFYLAVLLQNAILVSSLYAHPILWSKYIWFSFGVAGALMIHKSHEPKEMV